MREVELPDGRIFEDADGLWLDLEGKNGQSALIALVPRAPIAQEVLRAWFAKHATQKKAPASSDARAED